MNKKTEEKLNKIVKDNYEAIADHYSETRKKVLWEGLFELAAKVPERGKVLDVGCGSGKLLQAFRKKEVDYLGIDPSNALLVNAKKQYPKYDFRNGDIMQLNGFDTDYDFVFCIAVLQHIPGRNNRVDSIKQLKNKINDKGRVVLTVWNMYNNKKYKKLILKNIFLKLIGKNKMEFGDIVFDWKNSKGEAVSTRYYHAYSSCELKRDCVKAGMKVVEMHRRDNNIYAILEK